MKIIKALSVLSAFLLAPLFAKAHVGYVIPAEDIATSRGTDFNFLFSAVHDPINVILIILTVVLVLLLYWLSHKNYFIEKRIEIITTRLQSYGEFIPWILRLALGMALVGAGAKGVLISPVFPIEHAGLIAGIEIATGFALLAGFLLVPCAVIACGLILAAILQDSYLIGNMEFLAGGLALLILDNARPGIDDIIGFKRMSLQSLKPYVPFILRAGIGISLIFLAFFEKILNPNMSLEVVRMFNLTSAIPVSESMWVMSVGIIELAVGLFLLVGFHTRLTAVIAFFVITVTFFFFQEDVYSHITLFGILSAIFITGGGKWSLDRLWYKYS